MELPPNDQTESGQTVVSLGESTLKVCIWVTESLHTELGFTSTASPVIAGVDIAGNRAIVIVASSGIGVETAQALASAGA